MLIVSSMFVYFNKIHAQFLLFSKITNVRVVPEGTNQGEERFMLFILYFHYRIVFLIYEF